MSVEEDRITVFFASEGYRVLSIAAVHGARPAHRPHGRCDVPFRRPVVASSA